LITFLQLSLSGLLLGGVYSLISIGLTLIFGVARLINFAHGEFLMLAMYGSFWLWQLAGVDPYISLPVVAVAAGLLGALTERLIVRRALGKPAVVQVFSTLGLSVALQSAALFMWRGDFRSVRTSYSQSVVRMGELSVSVPRLVAFGIAGVTTVLLFVFLRFTYAGWAVRATAQNRDAARLMGVNVERVHSIVFMLGTALVGVAAALLVPIYPVYPTVGVDLILIAFVVVVLGGLGSIPGAMLGGLLLGLVETWGGFYVAPGAKQAVYFVLFIVVLVMRPNGLFGVRGAEEMGFQ
jgi:branched-chain amino acid transport system permease protein